MNIGLSKCRYSNEMIECKPSIQATWRIGTSACSCYVIPNASASLFKCFFSPKFVVLVLSSILSNES
ncbi:hypothetical protein HanPSC8_Chr15g0677781 [Helianthus annuus]|nr:hypothetical protein HanPSC8_Chr15g0677781 [Helianthus annuus]